jgi:hypothetical protein
MILLIISPSFEESNRLEEGIVFSWSGGTDLLSQPD